MRSPCCAGGRCSAARELLAGEDAEAEAHPGGEEDEIQAPEEETRPFKAMNRPEAPTQEEIDRHRIDHLPYRAWCPECVEGFGRERPHRASQDHERSIPLISLDYMYLARSGVFAREELPQSEREGAIRIIVAKCVRTQCLFAHAVPQKGVDPDGYVITQLKDDILWLGHSQVVLRSDNEPALVRVVEKVANALKNSAGVQSAACEGSVPYDPQTNGHAEGAVRLMKGQFRTLLLGLERRLAGRIPLDHPALAWLVSHSAYVRNVRIVGSDGATAQQRARGNPNFPPLLSFGEVCRYKARSKEGGIGPSAWRWGAGVWLGIDKRTNQYVLYDHKYGGIKYARTLKLMPAPQQWSLEMVQQVCVTPWAEHEPSTPVIVPREAQPEIPSTDRPAQARQAYLKPADFDRFGYTEHCPKCDAMRAGISATMPHSAACRRRIEAGIAASPGGAARLQRVADRQTAVNRQIAERMEQELGPRVAEPVAAQGEEDEHRVPAEDERRVLADEASPEHPENQQAQDGQPQDPPTFDDTMGENPGAGMDVDVVAPGNADPELNYVLNLGERDCRREIRRQHREALELAYALGVDGRRYRRESIQRLRAIVSEVYSAPRVTDAARRFPRIGILPGTAFDLTSNDSEGNPWDFSIPSQRRKAEAQIEKEKPVLLIGSPMCTPFSNIQNINRAKRDPRIVKEEIDKARLHLAWCCKLYRDQIARGAYFLHEHPRMARSWSEPCVQRVLGMAGVHKIVADQCQLGQEDDWGEPIKKPTGFMSNSAELLKVLEVRCLGKSGNCSRPSGGRHVPCLGSRARRAAIFQDKLCTSILRGIRNQLVADGRMHENEVGLTGERDRVEDANDHIKEFILQDDKALAHADIKKPLTGHRGVCNFVRGAGGCARGSEAPHGLGSDSFALKFSTRADKYVDDLTGLPLRPDLCIEARKQEIDYFKSKSVWELRPISEARRRMGRSPISVRWVETNKGDDDNPRVRSRLVAREIRTAGQNAIFAPTPPLESLRMVLSWAATNLAGGRQHVREASSEDRTQVLLIDISRAYFNAKTDDKDPIYVELPPEANAPPGMCGLLRRHMYGTRRAAEGWQDEYSGTLIQMGFTQGAASPCVFAHKTRGIIVSVHGDDFTAAGPKRELDWFEGQMKAHYELTVGGRLGPGPRDDKEATVLNRVIRWTPQGLEYEADPRQVEKLLQELELDGEGVKGVVTPGLRALAHQIKDEVQLPEREHTKFRGLAARANYLAADRPDVIFAAKEVCRLMAKPTDLAMCAIKRLGRYLRNRPRLVFQLPFQSADRWDVYTDTDWAGCPRTRKSTSGGCLMLGAHVIKCWSSTQASLALSSGEAEYYGVVKGTGVGLGQQALGRDAGFELPVRVWTDSSAAIGTASRQGLGKLRHLECHSLWVQQRLRRREFELRKVNGTENPADLFTKHMDSASKLNSLVGMFGCAYRDGRPSAAPELKRSGHAQARDEGGSPALAGHDRGLPHTLAKEVIDQEFPAAIPEEDDSGEPDVTPAEELSDPVPRLRRPVPHSRPANRSPRRKAVRHRDGLEDVQSSSHGGVQRHDLESNFVGVICSDDATDCCFTPSIAEDGLKHRKVGYRSYRANTYTSSTSYNIEYDIERRSNPEGGDTSALTVDVRTAEEHQLRQCPPAVGECLTTDSQSSRAQSPAVCEGSDGIGPASAATDDWMSRRPVVCGQRRRGCPLAQRPTPMQVGRGQSLSRSRPAGAHTDTGVAGVVRTPRRGSGRLGGRSHPSLGPGSAEYYMYMHYGRRLACADHLSPTRASLWIGLDLYCIMYDVSEGRLCAGIESGDRRPDQTSLCDRAQPSEFEIENCFCFASLPHTQRVYIRISHGERSRWFTAFFGYAVW